MRTHMGASRTLDPKGDARGHTQGVARASVTGVACVPTGVLSEYCMPTWALHAHGCAHVWVLRAST